MNSVSIIGKIPNPPKFGGDRLGRKTARFTLATIETRWDKDGNPKKWQNSHSVVAWGHAFQKVKNLVSAGSTVAIEGRLMNRFFAGSNGQKRMVSEIEANDVIVVD